MAVFLSWHSENSQKNNIIRIIQKKKSQAKKRKPIATRRVSLTSQIIWGSFYYKDAWNFRIWVCWRRISDSGEFWWWIFKKIIFSNLWVEICDVVIANWGNTNFENCQFLSRHLLLKSYLLRILSVLNALLIIWSFSTSSLCLPSFKKQKSLMRQRNRANNIMNTHVSIRSISTYQHSTAIYSPMLSYFF